MQECSEFWYTFSKDFYSKKGFCFKSFEIFLHCPKNTICLLTPLTLNPNIDLGIFHISYSITNFVFVCVSANHTISQGWPSDRVVEVWPSDQVVWLTGRLTCNLHQQQAICLVSRVAQGLFVLDYLFLFSYSCFPWKGENRFGYIWLWKPIRHSI